MSQDPYSAAIAFYKAHPMPTPMPRPIYSEKVSCGHSGFASPAQGHEQNVLDLNQRYVTNRPATFYFWVKGNSMERARVFDGSMVIVDKSIRPKSSDVILAAVEGEWMVKRLYQRGSVVKLLSDSNDPSHKPITFHEGQELEVFGVVTYAIQPPT